jgi:hypothetical protein
MDASNLKELATQIFREAPPDSGSLIERNYATSSSQTTVSYYLSKSLRLTQSPSNSTPPSNL